MRFGCRYKDESQQTFATTFAIRRKKGDKLGYCIFFIGGESTEYSLIESDFLLLLPVSSSGKLRHKTLYAVWLKRPHYCKHDITKISLNRVYYKPLQRPQSRSNEAASRGDHCRILIGWFSTGSVDSGWEKSAK